MKSLACVAVALAMVGCNKKSEVSPAASAAPPAPVAPSSEYALTSDAPECKAGATCTATIRLEARGAYHLNDEYPFKFTAGDNATVEFLGTDAGGRNVFTKAAGDFMKQSATVGVMTVKFKPAAQGSLTIEGVYKLSVCSEADCKLDSPSAKVTLAVK